MRWRVWRVENARTEEEGLARGWDGGGWRVIVREGWRDGFSLVVLTMRSGC